MRSWEIMGAHNLALLRVDGDMGDRSRSWEIVGDQCQVTLPS